MRLDLPANVIATATLRGNEYSWAVGTFLDALENAHAAGFGCIGGQFQFRFPDAICEMWWHQADAGGPKPGEDWSSYVKRSTDTIRTQFLRTMESANFLEEAREWPMIQEKMRQGVDP